MGWLLSDRFLRALRVLRGCSDSLTSPSRLSQLSLQRPTVTAVSTERFRLTDAGLLSRPPSVVVGERSL